jgi:hypothetical protein
MPHSTWRRDCVAVSVMIARPSAGMSPVTPVISNAFNGVELEDVPVNVSTPTAYGWHVNVTVTIGWRSTHE